MIVPVASPKQIGTIHGLAGRIGMDEAERRAFMRGRAGVDSAKLLTAAQADLVIAALRNIAGDKARPPGSVAGLDSVVAKKLRALWIAAYNLGVVRDRTDRAMLAFVERQTGVSHTRFLGEPAQGNKAVEGLKSWLAREASVTWPAKPDVVGNKRAILDAQWLRLVAIGAVTPFASHMPLADLDAYAFRVAGKNGWAFLSPRDLDLVQAALGRKLRAALARTPVQQDATGKAA
jgi:hypothetical protein